MKNEDSAVDISPRVRLRFAFFEQRIFWEGRMTRTDLMNRFSISAPQASIDIALYLDLFPDNVTYDRSLKEYVATPEFVPHFFEPDARKYLTQLLQIADHAMSPGESWLGAPLPNDAVPRVRRKLSVETLRPVVLAIRRRQAIEIRYQSMRAPTAEVRSIAPHALFFDGFRWHARAWCYRKSSFGDFVLARMLWVGDARPANVPAKLDGEWEKIVTIRLGTNPKLAEAARRALELDYGMTDGEIEIRMRLCTVFYFTKHLGLDLDEALLPANRQQIVWLNRDEIELQMRRDLFESEHDK
jgi:WYL domain